MILRKDHRMLVYGMTGRQGTFWTKAMIDYGASVAGGVNRGVRANASWTSGIRKRTERKERDRIRRGAAVRPSARGKERRNRRFRVGSASSGHPDRARSCPRYDGDPCCGASLRCAGGRPQHCRACNAGRVVRGHHACVQPVHIQTGNDRRRVQIGKLGHAGMPLDRPIRLGAIGIHRVGAIRSLERRFAKRLNSSKATSEPRPSRFAAKSEAAEKRRLPSSRPP